MAEYVERVEIGVDIVVDEKSVAKAQRDTKKAIDRLGKPGSGGASSAGGAGEAAKKVGSELDKVGRQFESKGRRAARTWDKVGRAISMAGESLRRAFGSSMLSDALEGLGTSASIFRDVFGGLLVQLRKMGPAGRTVAKYVRPIIQLMRGAGPIVAGFAKGFAVVAKVAGVVARVLGPLARLLAFFASGPVGWATAALLAGAYALSFYRKKADEAAAANQRLNREFQKLRPKLVEGTDKTIEAEAARDQRGSASFGNRIGSLLSDVSLQGGEGVARARVAALLEEKRITQEIAAERARLDSNDELVTGSIVGRLVKKKSLREQEVALQQQLIAIERANLQVIERQTAEKRKQVAEDIRALEAAKQRAQQEMSVKARLAQLDPFSLQEGQRLFKEFEKTGDLSTGRRARQFLGGIDLASVTEAEANSVSIDPGLLQELLGKQSATEQLLVEKGKELTGENTVEAFSKMIDTLKKKDAALVTELEEASAEIVASIGDLTEAMRPIIAQIAVLQEQIIEAQRDADTNSGS